MNAEQPVLLKLFAALPLRFFSVPLPSGDAWTRADQWRFGHEFFYAPGARGAELLFWARAACLFWGCLLLGAVYAVSRDYFGPVGGAISLTLVTCCPLVLGHSHFVTMDVGLAALSLLSAVSFDRWLRSATWWRAVQAGVLLGGALITKSSAFFLLVALPAIGLVRHLAARVAGTGEEIVSGKRRRAELFLSWALLVGSCTLVIWAAYRFHATEREFAFDWQRFDEIGVLTMRLTLLLKKAHLLPEAFLYGIALQGEHLGMGHEAYALGGYSQSGWPWYFLFALGVKTPLPVLAFWTWGIVLLVRSRKEVWADQAFLIVPPALFACFGLLANINIGLRYLLPVIPFLMVLSGRVGRVIERSGCPSRWPILAVLLLGIGLVDAVAIVPAHLSYFNWAARLAAEPSDLLVDSNLDWGQDLGRLKRYMEEHGIPRVKLSYFGSASPAALGLEHRILPSFNMYSNYEHQWRRTWTVESGDVVAVSATNLVGVYLPDHYFFRRILGDQKPFAKVGSSIYLYRIPGPDRGE